MPKYFQAVTVGDPHFDKMGNLLKAQHLDLQIAELRKPFEYAVQNGIQEVWVLGDVAHKERLSEEARIALFKLLEEYDGRVIVRIILGNHDVAYDGFHALQFFVELFKSKKFKTVFIYDKKKQVVINGVPVNFLPYPATQALPHDTSTCDKSINVAHLERPGALRDNGMKIKKGDGVKQRDKNVWVIGHLHTPQTVGLTWYSGTLYQTSFGESLPKSFMHIKARVDKDGLLDCKIKRIPVDPAFKLIPLVIEKRKDFKKIEDNPLYLYKLFIKSGVDVDFDIHKRYPNVWNSPVLFDDKKKIVLDAHEVEEIKYDIREGLKPTLKEMGATKPQIKRAQQLVDKILAKIAA